MRLGYWKFNNTNLLSEAGQGPTTYTGWSLTNSWDGTALCMTNTDTSSQLIYSVDYGGQSVFTPSNGTLRWWFQPDWSTGPSAPSGGVTFFRAGLSIDGLWELSVVNAGPTTNCGLLQFLTYSNVYQQQHSFQTGPYNGALVNFQAGRWYQMALTYSPTNIAIYTNGVLLATACVPPVLSTTGGLMYEKGVGVSYYPDATYLTGGFCFGNIIGHASAVLGQLDELETFNYPLTAQAIAAGFPSFGGVTGNTNDTDYDGRSDMLETNVDGTNPADSNSVAPCRLGYWRFDTSWLYSEQGQMPKSQSGVTLSNSWSGTAANIGGSSSSQLTYWDVFTNGWANINCQQGCVRFWFKPNWNSGGGPSTAPFVYLGNPTPGNGEWSLQMTSSGSAIEFVTASGGVPTLNIPATTCSFSANQWSQIVLDYGPGGSVLFINGAVVASNNIAVVSLPSAGDRARGMVIGNDTSYAHSINGQFEEMETFNYPLSSNDIAANFQAVQAVDTDLDGIPDLLEEITNSRPFLGAPVTIAGTIEAEQFDMGGSNNAYHNISPNPTNSYRPTGMYISKCNDSLGMARNFGYCLDQTRAGEWAQYTINVLVPGLYTVEVRAEAIGADTNGVFQCDFTNGVGVLSNGAGISNSTGPLMISTNHWTNVSAVVYLPGGTNVMRLNCLNNGVLGTNVGRFDYISIYPWWQAGIGTPAQTITLSTNATGGTYELIADATNWAVVTNNAIQIQKAVSALDLVAGGRVVLPAGTFYVAQTNPNETNYANQNAAVSILGNNVEIMGAGQYLTTLVAFDRVTTIFCLGQDGGTPVHKAPSINFTLRDMTLQSQPHNISVTNSYGGGFTNEYEMGEFSPPLIITTNSTNGSDASPLTIFYAISGGANNILISNCYFLHAYRAIALQGVTNCVIRSNNFVVWDTNCLFTGAVNSPATSNTVPQTGNNVNIMGAGYNVDIVDNNYIGNSTYTGTNVVNTTNVGYFGPDGFIWMQIGGNFFIARNQIANYVFEAIQLNAGPNSVVGNTETPLVMVVGTCGLCANRVGFPGLTGYGLSNFSTTFVGNSVYGGWAGQHGDGLPGFPYSLNFSGNSLYLFPPFDELDSSPSFGVTMGNCLTVSVCGNTLLSGSYGVYFSENASNALILNNDFGKAAYNGIGYADQESSIATAQVFGNTIGQGVNFHLQLLPGQGSGWFLGQNQYLNGTNNVPLFTDPAAAPVHVFY